MTWQAVAPLVLVKNQSGHIDYHYQGSIIPWLSEEQEERFLDEGMVVEVDDADDDAADAAGAPGGRPRKTASQEAWAAYAVTQGADPDEAKASSRQDLIELYGKD